MTVCIATVFDWNYPTPDGERAKVILTASDRQITAGDVEYEPNQQKICFLTKHILLLVAGDMAIHSEAIRIIQLQLRGSQQPQTDVGVVAEMYAGILRKIKFRLSSQAVLGPLGLEQDTFYSNQHQFSPEFLDRVTNELEACSSPETEAIIAGVNDIGAWVCVIDHLSRVSFHTDIGFAAIGIGAWHAKSAFMQSRYTNNVLFAPALAMTYLAKKRAEIAPGVGASTDMYLITKSGWEPVRPTTMTKASELYKEFEDARTAHAAKIIQDLNDFITKPSDKEKDKEK